MPLNIDQPVVLGASATVSCGAAVTCDAPVDCNSRVVYATQSLTTGVHTADMTKCMLWLDGTDGAVTVTLDTATDGQLMYFVRVDAVTANVVTVAPKSGDSIYDADNNAVSSFSLLTRGRSTAIVYNSADTTWYTINNSLTGTLV